MTIGLETGVRLLAGILLLAANGFFVTTEFALTRVRQYSESEFTGHPGLERAWSMTDELEIYLSGCQLGITISSVALGLVAEPAVSALLGAGLTAVGITASPHAVVSIVISITLINLAHVVFAEQIPTYLGVERARTVAKYGSLPLYIWTRVFSPVIRGADRAAKFILGLVGVTITRSWTHDGEEKEPPELPTTYPAIRREMGSLLRGSALSPERQREILNALDIGGLPVAEIMVPTDDVVALSTAQSLDEAMETMRENPHTRYPLRDGETYIGLIYSSAVIKEFEALQAGETTLEAVAVPIPTVSPDTPVSDVIDRFQAEKQELALITSADNAPVPAAEVRGIVTSTDAFEAITGDIDDPLD